MNDSWHLPHLPIWAIFSLTLLLVLVVIEFGYRRGRAEAHLAVASGEQEKEAPVGAMVGAALGLLALLLAFTFGMAAEAFHGRKVALLDEANAIRTAYLRAGLVPEPHAGEMRVLLRERSRIPLLFWVVLYAMTGLTLSAMGYHSGVAGTKRSPVTVAVAMTFTLVIVRIADLDRPGEGWVNVSQEPMLELRSALAQGSGFAGTPGLE